MSNHALSWTPFASSPGRPIVNFPPAPSFASAGWASAYNFAQPCAGCDVTQSCHPQAFFGSPLTLDLGLAEWRSWQKLREVLWKTKKNRQCQQCKKRQWKNFNNKRQPIWTKALYKTQPLGGRWIDLNMSFGKEGLSLRANLSSPDLVMSWLECSNFKVPWNSRRINAFARNSVFILAGNTLAWLCADVRAGLQGSCFGALTLLTRKKRTRRGAWAKSAFHKTEHNSSPRTSRMPRTPRSLTLPFLRARQDAVHWAGPRQIYCWDNCLVRLFDTFASSLEKEYLGRRSQDSRPTKIADGISHKIVWKWQQHCTPSEKDMLKRAPYDPLLQCPSQNSFSFYAQTWLQPTFFQTSNLSSGRKAVSAKPSFRTSESWPIVGLCWALLGWELVRKLWNRETLSITAASNASGGSSYNMSSLEFENFAGKALLLRVAVESVFLSIVRVSRIPTKWQPKGSKSKFF